jgi:hypothetical protein
VKDVEIDGASGAFGGQEKFIMVLWGNLEGEKIPWMT